VAALTIGVVALAACGDDDAAEGPAWDTGPPVGEAVLPDLVPAAPTTLNVLSEPGGSTIIRFTSLLVNVGDGDFVLRGVRTGGDTWEVDQEVPYSDSGAEVVPTDAEMVWGGDGHFHWHVSRVASYRLVPLDESGAPIEGVEGWVDQKVGFCFFDTDHVVDRGPEEPQYKPAGCGTEEDDSFFMGLSPGWGDTYIFSLPGQSIDVTDLPDGKYRLWAEVDERAWFRESNRDNNRTWADIDLSTLPDGLRTALVVAVGPEPE
jgi:hypothetical protein